MDKELTIGQRVSKGRAAKKFSQVVLAKALNMTPAGVSHIESGKSNLTIDNAILISSILGVNVDWLLTGEGEMVKGAISNATPPSPKQGTGGLPAMVTVDGQGKENIVLVNTKAQGGYPTLHQDPEFYGELPVLRLPLERFQHSTYRAWEVVGPSMQPGLHPGSIVISQFVENWHTGSIRNGYIHVIVTKETVLIKRLIDRRQKGYFGLMSDNEEFATFNLPLEDVQEIWTVTGALVWHFPNSKFEERFKISKLVTDYVDLEERLRKLEKQLKN